MSDVRRVLAALGGALALALALGLHEGALAESTSGPAVLAQRSDSSDPARLRETSRGEAKPHRTGELDCRQCHLGKHQGVLQMYIGMGGRGTPMVPSHMFQVRVECIACHVAPEEAATRAGIVGQTFRPSEQACVGCHGEQYRGMIERWTTTLGKMHEILASKLADTRAALEGTDPRTPKHARARELVEDADYNTRFVRLAHGVHNVFYAADLLKLANGWLDEAITLVGKSRLSLDDTLVRGGYCGVLCHQQAGVRQLAAVSFGTQRLPHVRHVTEFGAVCTACHSAEVHKAVTATAATCSACHHSPQNDRCESCHRAQTAFYRGEAQTKLAEVEPNVMAAAVTCTGCHDWTRKHSRQAVGQKCLECHDEAYTAFVEMWTGGLDEQAAEASKAVNQAEGAIASARRAGRKVPEAERLIRDARDALSVVRRARGAHNPAAAETLLDVAKRKADEALARLGRKG